MAGKRSRFGRFSHNTSHVERNSCKKTPALKPPATSRKARTKGPPNDKDGNSTQPFQCLHSSLTSHHDLIHEGNSAAEEHEQQCLLFSLPDELLLEIAALLCTTDEYGNVDLHSIKSFSLVSQRARRVTTERLPLTVSGWCPSSRPFRQLMASTEFLGRVKKLVLKHKPTSAKLNTGSLKINRILSLMPCLLELNIHVGVPLAGILRKGQLPTVRKLSVAINQEGPDYEATSIIRACPDVTLLRLNLTGRRIRNQDGDGVSRPECRRALEAAAALGSLRAVEMFRFGSILRNLEVQRFGGTLRLHYASAIDAENGWIPGDLKVIKEYFLNISSLALYGNVGYDDPRRDHARISDLLIECGGITNLSSLTMTTEPIDIWRWSSQYDGSLFFADPDQDQEPDQEEDEEEDEELCLGGGANGRVCPRAVGKAFETCTNLRKLSFVSVNEVRTWATASVDPGAHGADEKVFKTCDSVNSKYALRMTRLGYSTDRWF